MNQFTKKKHFIGIDISKEHLDLALVDERDSGVFSDKKVENSFSGFGKIKSWLPMVRLLWRKGVRLVGFSTLVA